MKILVLKGDGIGPEIVNSSIEIVNLLIDKLDLKIDLINHEIGYKSLELHGTTFKDTLLETCKKSDGIILGPVDHNNYPPIDQGGINPSAILRSKLNLYANIRPAKGHPKIKSKCNDMDLIIVRENTEGFYSDRNMITGIGEFCPEPGIGLSIRKITRNASKRIAKCAFEIASSFKKFNKDSRTINVHAIHKANVLRLTDGIFLNSCREISELYPNINYSELIVDAAAAHIVREPSKFDVIVTTNMFGDILSDLASELSGSIGMGGSINFGENLILAQAQHGSAPDIAGKGIANPLSMISSVSMMFQWLGKKQNNYLLSVASNYINKAMAEHLNDTSFHTPDLGGNASSKQVTNSILKILNNYIK